MEMLSRQEILTRNELMTLIQSKYSPSVSLYMPTSWIGADMQQNQIRFKNLLRTAAERLSEYGVRPAEIEDMLAPAQTLQKNSPFWRQQNTGLAVFIAKDFFHYYRLPLELPELISVRERFRIQPLFPLFSRSGRFYLLAVSKKSVRFFLGMRNCIIELEQKSLPKGMEDTLKYDVSDRQTRTRPGTGKGSTGLFHGHGGWQDESKDQVVRFLTEIDRGLHQLLKEEQVPLVFAGIDHLFGFYREICSYPHLLDKAIIGNPDGQRPDELNRQAWELVQPFYKAIESEAIGQYRASVGTGLTSAELTEIVPAAYNGRIGILFASAGCRQLGRFRPEDNEVLLEEVEAPGTEELCDYAATYTFLNQGIVHELQPQEMPDGKAIAALYRY